MATTGSTTRVFAMRCWGSLPRRSRASTHGVWRECWSGRRKAQKSAARLPATGAASPTKSVGNTCTYSLRPTDEVHKLTDLAVDFLNRRAEILQDADPAEKREAQSAKA